MMVRSQWLGLTLRALLAMVALVSCSSDWDEGMVDAVPSSKALSIKVSNLPFAKSRVSGTSMPDGARLGVFLRATNGSRYDNLTLNGLTYLATGTGNGQRWEVENGQPFSLSRTVGSSYAYYPCKDPDLADLKVPIRNDGTDWMYSRQPATNLSVDNPIAQFEMAHAMALIRCRILRGFYGGPGNISTAALSSASLAKEANMDLVAGNVTDFRGTGEEIAFKDVGTLAEEPMVIEFWAIPTTVEDKLSFRLVVDGSQYKVSTSNILVEAGVVYNYAITIEEKQLVISSATVEEWVVQDRGGSQFEVADLWHLALQTDGVYAIDLSGNPVAYDNATEDTYAGVAFVVDGKVYQVAKVDAFGSDGTKVVYWHKTGYFDIPQLPNYSKADPNRTSGYLPKADGSYTNSSSALNVEYWSWKNFVKNVVALSDFDGTGNTEILVAQLGSVNNSIGKAVLEFRKNIDINDGYTDWFVPSSGQLGFIALKVAQIEAILSKIPGAETFYRENSTDYWSSTEASADRAWYFGFFDGGMNRACKYNDRPKRCRLIREIK